LPSVHLLLLLLLLLLMLNKALKPKRHLTGYGSLARVRHPLHDAVSLKPGTTLSSLG